MPSPRRKRFILVLVVLAVATGVIAWQWHPIRVRLILMGSGTDQEKAESLRELGTPAIPALIGAFESEGGSWETRSLLGGILAREPYRRLVVLERNLDAEDRTLRRVAASLLIETRNLDERDTILTCLRDWLADPEFGHRIDLADAAAGFRGPGSVEILSALISDRERARRARVNATRYLGTYFREDPEVVPPLVGAALEDPSEVVRASAAQALGAVGYAEDMSVYEALVDAESDLARQMLANGLGALRSAKTGPLLARLLRDRKEVVRRSALRSLSEPHRDILVDQAETLREDWFMGVRGDLSEKIGELEVKSLLPVLIPGLMDEEPDEQVNIVRKTIWSLYALTGKHHGFPEALFRRSRQDLVGLQEAGREWVAKPLEERERIMRRWGEEYGSYDRRPALLGQLGHADPANVAWAVRELHELDREAPTPGFDDAVVRAAAGVVDPEDPRFRALVDAARAFQDLPGEDREKLLAEWRAR